MVPSHRCWFSTAGPYSESVSFLRIPRLDIRTSYAAPSHPPKGSLPGATPASWMENDGLSDGESPRARDRAVDAGGVLVRAHTAFSTSGVACAVSGSKFSI